MTIPAYYDAPMNEGSGVMRGADEQPGSMFSSVSLEARVPADHPLRAIRRITDRALTRLSPTFGTLYVHFGRPSIPPGGCCARCCCKRSAASAASGS